MRVFISAIPLLLIELIQASFDLGILPKALKSAMLIINLEGILQEMTLQTTHIPLLPSFFWKLHAVKTYKLSYGKPVPTWISVWALSWPFNLTPYASLLGFTRSALNSTLIPATLVLDVNKTFDFLTHLIFLRQPLGMTNCSLLVPFVSSSRELLLVITF